MLYLVRTCTDVAADFFLPIERNAERVHAVLPDELAIRLLRSYDDESHILIVGFVLNHAHFFTAEVVALAEQVMVEIYGSTPGKGRVTVTPVPAPSEDVSEFEAMFRLFAPPAIPRAAG